MTALDLFGGELAAPTNGDSMLPRTKHGLDSYECISALQKHIRRGNDLEAMRFAVEMMITSKAYFSRTINRLQVIVHEDIDTVAHPEVLLYADTAMSHAREWYDPDPMKLGKSCMAIGNLIRLLCRSPKSRTGDHFQASVRLASILEDYKPEVPDFALDKHTRRGKQKGRDLGHFRSVGARLNPMPKQDDYEEEAYRLWKLSGM